MGTPDFSVPCLSLLLSSKHQVVGVYSRAPKPAGRGKKEQMTPIHQLGVQHGIEVFTPKSLRSEEEISKLKALKPDLIVVVAYGLILPKAVLDIPQFGCINVHASLLPRWRGAAPIQRAIMAGDTQTGVCIMQMDEGLDTGAVGVTSLCKILESDTSQTLHDKLAQLGSQALAQAIEQINLGQFSPMPQPDEGGTYAAKIDKAEARINWHQERAALHNHIHGLSPFPGAWCEIPMLDGTMERIKILQVEYSTAQLNAAHLDFKNAIIGTHNGSLKLLKVQRPGKSVMNAEECFRGMNIAPLCELN